MTPPTSRVPGTPSTRRTTVHERASVGAGLPLAWRTHQELEQETKRG
jgi:hypothetical protein